MPTTSGEEPSQESEYDAFEELAKKLLTVSKKDLDSARAREEAEKR